MRGHDIAPRVELVLREGDDPLTDEQWRQAIVLAVLVARAGGKVTIPLTEAIQVRGNTLHVWEDRMNDSLVLVLKP